MAELSTDVKAKSVLSGYLIHMVDDDDLDGRFAGFDPQTQFTRQDLLYQG